MFLTVLLSLMALLIILPVHGRVLPVDQGPISGGCGVPVEEPVVVINDEQFVYRGGYSGVSTKRHWVPLTVVACKEYSFYETYQVGVCNDGIPRCNIKQYKNKIRTSMVC